MKARFWALLILLVLAGCDNGPARAVGQVARDRISLISEAPEPIVEILVREGDTVEPGQVILRQQPERIAARLASLQAEQDRAAARLAELRRGPRRERIEQTQAELRGAQAELRNARRHLKRIDGLVARKLASTADLDRARAQQDTAAARVEAIEADLEALLEGTTVEELQQAEAAYRAAQANLEETRVIGRRLTVTAPRAGQVDALPFEVGERPPAGAVVAVLLADDAPYARVYIPEPHRAAISAGTPLSVNVDGYDKPFDGQVRFVASDAAFTPFFALTEYDRSRLSFLAEIDLDTSDGRRPASGLPVQVDLSELNGD